MISKDFVTISKSFPFRYNNNITSNINIEPNYRINLHHANR